MTSFLEKSKISLLAKRHYLRVVAFAVLGGVIGALIVYVIIDKDIAMEPVTEVAEQQKLDYANIYHLEESLPITIRIPALGIDASFEAPLGVNERQEVEVPDAYDTVGWYRYGPTPGEVGPAVILGHVDSKAGPAIFYSLGQVTEGDQIYIDREDGSTATFEVTELERRPQGEFPTEEVYGDIDYAGLRLITCSGIYDHGIKRYSHNLIVFARLVE